jgi:hypothetical protein
LVGQILFIKAFFDTSDIILITAPSRIGKSSNMKMLKTFLENAIHNTMKKSCEFVEKADHQLTRNYKIFKDNQLNTYVEEKKIFLQGHLLRMLWPMGPQRGGEATPKTINSKNM